MSFSVNRLQRFHLMLILVGAICLGGCQDGGSNGSVALLDIQLVGQEVGAMARIDREVAGLRQQIVGMERELQQRQREMSAKGLTDEVKKDIFQKFQKSQMTYRQATAAYKKRVSELSGSFRKLVEGYAKKVADEQGYTIIMNFNSRSPNERILVWDNSINITEAVIKAMQAEGYTPPKKNAFNNQPARGAMPEQVDTKGNVGTSGISKPTAPKVTEPKVTETKHTEPNVPAPAPVQETP